MRTDEKTFEISGTSTAGLVWSAAALIWAQVESQGGLSRF